MTKIRKKIFICLIYFYPLRIDYWENLFYILPSEHDIQGKWIDTCRIPLSEIDKKIRICWKHFDPKTDFTSQVDLTDWKDCNGKGFGQLKKGTIPTKNLPESQGDLTLGGSVGLDHETSDSCEKMRIVLKDNHFIFL